MNCSGLKVRRYNEFSRGWQTWRAWRTWWTSRVDSKLSPLKIYASINYSFLLRPFVALKFNSLMNSRTCGFLSSMNRWCCLTPWWTSTAWNFRKHSLLNCNGSNEYSMSRQFQELNPLLCLSPRKIQWLDVLDVLQQILASFGFNNCMDFDSDYAVNFTDLLTMGLQELYHSGDLLFMKSNGLMNSDASKIPWLDANSKTWSSLRSDGLLALLQEVDRSLGSTVLGSFDRRVRPLGMDSEVDSEVPKLS